MTARKINVQNIKNQNYSECLFFDTMSTFVKLIYKLILFYLTRILILIIDINIILNKVKKRRTRSKFDA